MLTPKIVIIFTIYSYFVQTLEITDENTSNGLTFVNINSINVLEKMEITNFPFNITTINFLREHKAIYAQNCLNNTVVLRFDIETELNMKWKNELKPRKNGTNIGTQQNADENTYFDEIARNILKNFNRKGVNKCKNLDKLTYFLNEMNREFNNLASNDTDIEKLISIIDMTLVIENILKISSSYKIPFSLGQIYTDEFFRHTKHMTYLETNTLIISFEIPIYRHTNLYKVHSKPILKKKVPYLMPTDVRYATFLENRPTFYSNESFTEACFYKTNIFYCDRPKDFNENSCEHQMFNSTIKKNCLTRLKRRNIVTRIHDTLYCTLFEPMTFKVECEDITYYIKINNSAQITEKTCTLNNSFYVFDPNLPIQYEISFANAPNIMESTFFEAENLKNLSIYLTIAYLTLLTMIYFFTIGIGIVKMKKTKKNKLDAGTHFYESVGYYV